MEKRNIVEEGRTPEKDLNTPETIEKTAGELFAPPVKSKKPKGPGSSTQDMPLK